MNDLRIDVDPISPSLRADISPRDAIRNFAGGGWPSRCLQQVPSFNRLSPTLKTRLPPPVRPVRLVLHQSLSVLGSQPPLQALS
jgi:hypothetical protein